MGTVGLIKLFVIFTIFGLSHEDCCCQKKLREAGVIPQYAEAVCNANLDVNYGQAEIGDSKVKCGDIVNVLTPFHSPKVTFDVRGKCKYASIVAFDADTFEIMNPYLHWLVINIDPEDLAKGELGSADLPYHYVVFGFLDSKGKIPVLKEHHTCVFFVYCQSQLIDINDFPKDEKVNYTHRFKWIPREFADKYGLGCPIAATTFTLTADDNAGSVEPTNLLQNGGPPPPDIVPHLLQK